MAVEYTMSLKKLAKQILIIVNTTQWESKICVVIKDLS